LYLTDSAEVLVLPRATSTLFGVPVAANTLTALVNSGLDLPDGIALDSSGDLHISNDGADTIVEVKAVETVVPKAGYWLVALDGGVFSYGNARFHGSAVGLKPSVQTAGLAATSDDGGYWLVCPKGTSTTTATPPSRARPHR